MGEVEVVYWNLQLKICIMDLEKKARRKTQAKKKFEMFQRLKEYQTRLEKM